MSKSTIKAKYSPGQTVVAWFRSVFLASESFVLPTHAPYDESLMRLRQALADEPRLFYQERVIPEDEDSAGFVIHLYEAGSVTGSKAWWRKVATVKGRIVSQPAFGDALLQGEVFNGWFEVLTSFLWFIFSSLWAVASFVTLVNGVDEVPPTLFGGLLALLLASGAIAKLNDFPVRRQKLLDELAGIFEGNNS